MDAIGPRPAVAGPSSVAAAVLLAAALACGHSASAPTAPASTSLAGTWTGSLSDRAPCVGDWTSIVLTLAANGTGELATRDSQRFPAVLVSDAGARRIDVTLPPGPGECETLSFAVMGTTADGRDIEAFWGQATGRCCGTIQADYRFTRAAT